MGKRPPKAAKRDLSEPEIFEAIRDAGIQVYPLDLPLDALCGFNGYTFLVECKTGPKAPFTDGQKEFLKDWTGHAVVLTSQEEARVWAENITAEYGGDV